jgi:hypothetical protein
MFMLCLLVVVALGLNGVAFVSIYRKLLFIERQQRKFFKLDQRMEFQQMADLAAVRALAEETLTAARANTDSTESFVGIMTAKDAQIADLTQQLNDAIANDASPEELQAIADALTEANSVLNADTAREAALAGTPAEPTP